jgi:hypothetical protein
MTTMPVIKPFFVREPLGRGSHRSNITETQTASADHAVTDVEKRNALNGESIGTDQVAGTEQDAAAHGKLAGTEFGEIHPTPRCGHAKKENCQTESPGGLGVGPVVGGHDRLLEEAPSVNRAEAHLQQGSHDGYQPSVRKFLYFCSHNLLSPLL